MIEYLENDYELIATKPTNKEVLPCNALIMAYSTR